MSRSSDWRLPRIHPTNARVLLIALKRAGVDVDAVLAGSGTSAAQLETRSSLVSFNLFRRLVRSAPNQGRGGFGLELGALSPVTANGAVGVAMVASATLEEALMTGATYGGTRGRVASFRYAQRAAFGEVELIEALDYGELRQIVLEISMVHVCKLIDAVAGHALDGIVHQFPYPAPPWANRYGDYLNGRVEFESDAMRIKIPREHLNIRSVTADAKSRAAAIRECEREASELELSPHRDLAPLIRSWMAAAAGEYPSLEKTAESFDVSPRTLIRRLREKGLRYRDLVDESRAELACWRLVHTEDAVEQIAADLGYGDPSNFSRTFRRWLGVTPSDYRRQSRA